MVLINLDVWLFGALQISRDVAIQDIKASAIEELKG